MNLISGQRVMLCVMISILGLGSVSFGEWSVELHGYTMEEEVRLLWLVDGWPEGLQGFRVKRRQLGGGTWITLSEETIYPEISKSRNWLNEGLDMERAADVDLLLRKYVDEGLLRYVTQEEFHAELKEVGFRSGDRLRIKNDYNLALMLGFGYIDRLRDLSVSYEYGLFADYNTDAVSSDPIATYITQPVNVNAQVTNLKAQQHVAGVEVVWESDASINDQLDILTYAIYRQKPGEKEWALILPPSISAHSEGDDKLHWKFVDRKVDPYQSWRYAIAPVNFFQAEFRKIEVEYQPMDLLPADITYIAQTNEWVGISWKVNDSVEPFIRAHYVQRAIGSNDFYSISESLSPKARHFIDRGIVERGEVRYRIISVYDKGEERVSKIKSVLFSGKKMPGKVADLKVDFKYTNDVPCINASWKRPSKGDPTTHYRIYHDMHNQGAVVEDLSASILNTNSYSMIAKGDGARTVIVGLRGISADGRSGAASYATNSIPRLSAYGPLEVTVAMSYIDGCVYLKWKYPMSDDLLGFNIYQNGSLILDYENVCRNVRSWVLEDFSTSRANNSSLKLSYEVEAVFEYCRYRSSRPSNLTIQGGIPNRGRSAPRSFSALPKGVRGSERWVALKWANNVVGKEDNGTAGYRIQVSADSQFEGSDTLKLLECDTYYYQVPPKWRAKKLFFRCYAVDNNGAGGLGALAEVPADHFYWNRTLSDQKVVELKRSNAANEMKLSGADGLSGN